MKKRRKSRIYFSFPATALAEFFVRPLRQLHPIVKYLLVIPADGIISQLLKSRSAPASQKGPQPSLEAPAGRPGSGRL